MKLTFYLCVSFCFSQYIMLGQTNTFPSSGNVGIGTTSPLQKLSVNGQGVFTESAVGADPGDGGGPATRIGFSSQGYGYITANHTGVWPRNLVLQLNGGNVGIGTTDPRSRLDIGQELGNGELGMIFGHLHEGNSAGEGTYLGVRAYGTQPVNAKSFAIEHAFYGQVNSSINFNRGSGVEGGFLTFNTIDNTEQMRIDWNGNVGIGTTSPDAKLAVKGTIHSQEVKVDLSGSVAPDYVFEKDYPLTSLSELKSYIDQHKHLPEIPSAKEMEQEGINLKEMNLILLKKVEELTLHVMDLKKENEQQQKQLDALTNKG